MHLQFPLRLCKEVAQQVDVARDCSINLGILLVSPAQFASLPGRLLKRKSQFTASTGRNFLFFFVIIIL